MDKIKIYVPAILCCAALLGGCVKDGGGACDKPEPEPRPGAPEEMRFGVSSLQTRVNAYYAVGDIESMGVFGYTTGAEPYDKTNSAHTPNIFWNQKVKKDENNDWVYSPQAYWPVDLGVNNSFFAYAPYIDEFAPENRVLVSRQDASGHPTLRYSIPTENMDNMFDIVYATPMLNVNRLSPGVNDGRVQYNMRHAMSGISFLITGVDIVDNEGKPVAPDKNDYDLNWLAFMADYMPLTCTLDLGYVPVPYPTNPADYQHGIDYYGSEAWSAPSEYGSVYYELIDYDANNPHHDHGITIKPGELYRPSNGYEHTLFFFPKDITKQTHATIDLTFVVDDVEYYYYVDMPATYMHAGLVTVFVVTLSKDGITLEFKEHNLIEEWVRGNEGKPEEVEMY